ncbi:HK97-gp10 family putative phage morphogenesis protein [Pelagibacterium mangrovi]|uniref:HK97-gp10 family putative phage morphogenesis protein n=1 Tax=Pelagibacterium mangrovi TaxID=3119828 RepID=UPI002FC9ACB7
MRVTFNVVGLREVEKGLGELKAATARSVTRKALQAGGELIARDARAMVPRDTWGLHESIKVSGTLSPSQAAQHQKESEQEVFVGPDNRPQAVTQEFGTVFHPPQAYMRPAFDAQKHNVVKRIADELMVGVDRAVQRAARRGR